MTDSTGEGRCLPNDFRGQLAQEIQYLHPRFVPSSVPGLPRASTELTQQVRADGIAGNVNCPRTTIG